MKKDYAKFFAKTDALNEFGAFEDEPISEPNETTASHHKDYITKMKCPHCKTEGLIRSRYHPLTFGCDHCGNVFSEGYMQGYLHGLRDKELTEGPQE